MLSSLQRVCLLQFLLLLPASHVDPYAVQLYWINTRIVLERQFKSLSMKH